MDRLEEDDASIIGGDSDVDFDEEDDEMDGLTTVKTGAKKPKKPIKVKNDDDDDEDEDDEEDDEEDDDDEEEDEDPDMGGAPNDALSDNNSETLTTPGNFDDDFDTDVSDNEEDNYLQKFEDTNKINLLNSYHPELLSHNNDEIDALSIVTRDKDNNIIDELHKTVPFITKYEIARIIGERSKQIDSGAPIFVDIEENIVDSYLIALKEFNEKKIPFIIKRPLPNGGCEYWKLKDLEILV